jgi:hypothetical protein
LLGHKASETVIQPIADISSNEMHFVNLNANSFAFFISFLYSHSYPSTPLRQLILAQGQIISPGACIRSPVFVRGLNKQPQK